MPQTNLHFSSKPENNLIFLSADFDYIRQWGTKTSNKGFPADEYFFEAIPKVLLKMLKFKMKKRLFHSLKITLESLSVKFL